MIQLNPGQLNMHLKINQSLQLYVCSPGMMVYSADNRPLIGILIHLANQTLISHSYLQALKEWKAHFFLTQCFQQLVKILTAFHFPVSSKIGHFAVSCGCVSASRLLSSVSSPSPPLPFFQAWPLPPSLLPFSLCNDPIQQTNPPRALSPPLPHTLTDRHLPARTHTHS